jgi:hypothetical protein
MGQVVAKATGEWVYLEVPVESNGKVRTKNVYLYACIKPTCFTIYVYNSRDGTSLMTAHTCSRAAAAANSGSLHVWATKKGVPTDSAKAGMTNSLVNMCAWDIRSFALVDGPGFANVIHTALDIGFTSKTSLFAEDLLQSRQTIKRATMDRYDKGVVKTQAIAHKHFKDNGRAAFSTDIWTDKATQTSYSAVTMHLIDDNWVLHVRVVSCDEFSKGNSHTAPTIHRDFVKSVSPFITWKEETEIVQAVDWQVVVKSDAASNNRGAEGIQSQFELDLCYCHRILTCINYVLQKQIHWVDGVKQPPAYLFYSKSESVFDTIDDSKSLVTYMKQTLLNKQLKNKMKQDVAKSFDDLLIMLQSVFAELTSSIKLLKKKKQEDRAEKIFEWLLDELIRLLHYFKLANKSLEPFNTSTLHLLGMWKAKLKAHLQP